MLPELRYNYSQDKTSRQKYKRKNKKIIKLSVDKYTSMVYYNTCKILLIKPNKVKEGNGDYGESKIKI